MIVETSRGDIYVNVKEGPEPAVVFIHGIPTSSYLWRNIRINNRSIHIDLLGYGRSEKPKTDLSVKA